MTIQNTATIYNTPGVYNQGQGGGGGGVQKINIGGDDYEIIQINDKFWITRNLDYKFLYNGEPIKTGLSGSPNYPAAWYYDNDESLYGKYGCEYGLLYNFYAVKYLLENPDLLPAGWHIPNIPECDELFNFVGGLSNAGYNLRSSGFWQNDSWNGPNNYGFNALPTGQRKADESFVYNREEFEIYTSSLLNGVFSTYYTYAPNGSLVSYNNFANQAKYAYSIRLCKDA